MDLQKIVVIMLCTVMLACESNENGANTPSSKAPQHQIMLSADRVGDITAETPFNMHQVTLDFPDYSVEEFTDKKEVGGAPVIRISDNGKPFLILHPDQTKKSIYSVVIQSPHVGNTLGHNIGTVFSDIYSYEETEPCTTGSDELKGKVLCFAPKNPNILYVFAGKSDTPDTQTPPPGILASWKLDSIIWKPVR